ncbi:MAG: ABC transporter ATP-binding protein [Thermoguttaceae bacterium]|jgi:ATP-binding cassette subfamily B protein/subfamily B ATP-binding cassette protein MsbA
MKNFGRVLRLALRYRLTVAGVIASALTVAILWAVNFGTMLPFVKVVLQQESLQQWIDREIATAQREAAEQGTLIEALEREMADAPPDRQQMLDSAISGAEHRQTADRYAENLYRWLKPFVDRYVPSDAFNTLIAVSVVLVVMTLLKDIFLVTNNILVARLTQLATFDLRKLFYRRTLRLDLATFNDEGTTDLMSRFTYDMENVAGGLDALFGKLVREPLKLIACVVGAAWICWRLLLLSLVIAPLAALAIRWLAKTLRRANRRAMEQMAQLYNVLEETFRGIKIVKAFTNEPQERNRFHVRSKAYYKRALRIAGYDSLSHPMSEMMGIFMITLALLAGAWLVLKGKTHLLGIRMCDRGLSLDALLLFYLLLAGAADPLRKLSEVFSRFQGAVAACERIFTRLDREPSVRDQARSPYQVGARCEAGPRCRAGTGDQAGAVCPAAPAVCRRHHRELVFEGVGFAYQPGQPVLCDINLRIPFGQTVAVVGPNGCGKSTLANLIPRFADPTSGIIRLDDVPLANLRLRELRGQIGLVTQDPFLFDDTVLANIRYGRPKASYDQIVEAAKQAHAHRFIESELPNGYQTVVGTFGGRLSGGQRQRIALARAILRDPAILVLDEATSQIDLESEQAIQQALEGFIRGRTTLIITHRLAVLSLADRIVVMEAGRIVDAGTHDELVARSGLYRRLHQLQFDDLRRSA